MGKDCIELNTHTGTQMTASKIGEIWTRVHKSMKGTWDFSVLFLTIARESTINLKNKNFN